MKYLIATLIICMSFLTATNVVADWNPSLEEDAGKTIQQFKEKHANLLPYIEKSHAYVVFPEVTKAAIHVGGAYGVGVLYEEGEVTGQVTLMQVTAGIQFGGQQYSEIIFLKDKETLDRLKQGKLEFGAAASAIAKEDGVATNVEFNNGIAVFTLSRIGLMIEASVGGQKFKFEERPASSKRKAI